MGRQVKISFFIGLVYFASPVLGGNQCGDILVEDSGRLEYNVDVPYRDHERCSFIIKAPTSDSIKLILRQHGFPAGSANTTFIAVTSYVKDSRNPLAAHEKLHVDNAGEALTVEGSVLVVIFTTIGGLSSPGTGFILDYEGVPGSPIISDSSLYIFSPQFSSINYPALNGTLYKPHELSVIVFPPYDYRYIPGNVVVTKISVRVYGIEYCNFCECDALNTFEHDPKKVEFDDIQHLKQYCAPIVGTTYSFETVILVFTSDQGVGDLGFFVNWNFDA